MAHERARRRVLIMGAAGRDFHNFNMAYRDDPNVCVVAFTATQIPGIEGRRYPALLAGSHYPEGIPIEPQDNLEELIAAQRIHEVVFAYSDVPHAHVMHVASRVLAAGADFSFLGPERTMLRSRRPVIAISAVRTGSGKSQTARWLGKRLRERGMRAAVLRHPMPYGDLALERVQRFATLADLDAGRCTNEEREEYEPHIAFGNVVYAGVDYAAILSAAEEDAEIVIWDGGNNDFPFIKPDLHLVVVDALRPEQVASHHPGETVLRMADVIVVNKVDAPGADVARTIEAARALNTRARVVCTASPVFLADPEMVRGRRVLVLEDGPTITHGDMPWGAGYVAAQAAGAAAIVDPRARAAGSIRELFVRYPHIGPVLPAVGYGQKQLEDLERTINAADVDVVVSATPFDLGARIQINKPLVRARYELADAGEPTLAQIVDEILEQWDSLATKEQAC